jgi:hypothetical protein
MAFLSEETYKKEVKHSYKIPQELRRNGGIETICLFGHQGRWWSQWCNQPTYLKQIQKSKEAENEQVLQDKLFSNDYADICGRLVFCNKTW